jgi:hypothetical protein
MTSGLDSFSRIIVLHSNLKYTPKKERNTGKRVPGVSRKGALRDTRPAGSTRTPTNSARISHR